MTEEYLFNRQEAKDAKEEEKEEIGSVLAPQRVNDKSVQSQILSSQIQNPYV
ncbi:hypothetical protein [Microseira sp. BLCC-F43]|uniref:hypothetical protein n=1 Tax=Microseira sp. BLCC-F43 TaxID=3153602 RepID=UPI0035B71CEC